MARRPKDLISKQGNCHARAYIDAILKEPSIQLYWNYTREPKAMRKLGEWLIKAANWAEATQKGDSKNG